MVAAAGFVFTCCYEKGFLTLVLEEGGEGRFDWIGLLIRGMKKEKKTKEPSCFFTVCSSSSN